MGTQKSAHTELTPDLGVKGNTFSERGDEKVAYGGQPPPLGKSLLSRSEHPDKGSSPPLPYNGQEVIPTSLSLGFLIHKVGIRIPSVWGA